MNGGRSGACAMAIPQSSLAEFLLLQGILFVLLPFFPYKIFCLPWISPLPQNTVQFEYLYNSALWLQGQRLFSFLVSILLFTSFLKNHEKFSYTTFIYRRLYSIRAIQLSTAHKTKPLLSSPTSPSPFPSSSSTSAQLSILKGLILFQMEWLSNKP